MTSYENKQFPSTVGTVLIAVAFAAQVASASYGTIEDSPIETHSTLSTYGEYSHPVTGNFVDMRNSLDIAMVAAYENLLAKSVVPDPEIEAIISDNAWDLYEE